MKGLEEMSFSELSELLDRVEGAIRDYSEELVQQLARRDELEFEKEVKNSFITVLIEVQNKQKEHREMMKRRRKEKGLSLQSSRIERSNQMPLKVCVNFLCKARHWKMTIIILAIVVNLSPLRDGKG